MTLIYIKVSKDISNELDVSAIAQMHILLSRTAQTSLEPHFCVELNTKSPEKWAEKLYFSGGRG